MNRIGFGRLQFDLVTCERAMLNKKTMTVLLGAGAILFSPVLVAAPLVVFAFVVIFVCPGTRTLIGKSSIDAIGCNDCGSYICPFVVGLLMFGLPSMLLLARFILGRRASRKS